MRCLLNEKRIISAKAESKRQELWDLSLPGFGVRITKSGKKTFFVMCRDRGKQRRISLGSYPIISLAEARNSATDKLRLVSQNIPLELEKPAITTIQQACKSFIELYSKKKNKDWHRAETRLNNTLVAEYGQIDIKEIKKENVIALLDKIVARNAPIQANRVRSGISKFFKWCAERGLIENDPTIHITKPSKENPRDRVLSEDELIRVWHQIKGMGYPFGPLLQMLFLTGQRKGEVSNLLWSEIDFKNKMWVIPKEKAKNGRSHSVPLSDMAIHILENIPRFVNSDFVFTTTGRTSVSGFGRVKLRLDEASDVHDWIIHDIRRTVASGMARLRIEPYIVEKILNHTSGTFSGVAGIYNRHGYNDEKREALQIWNNYLIRLGLYS